MKTILCLGLLLVHSLVADALLLPPPLQCTTTSTSFRGRKMTSASASMPEGEYQDALLEEVRQELVQKYLDQGEALAKAQREVDFFLQDAARSREYLAMRQYNLSQKDDGLGLDIFLGMQFLGAFLIGFMIHSVQDVSRIWETLF